MRAILDAVVESVAVAGSQGAPGGVLYSALMAHGCSLNQFQSIMGALVSTGKLRQEGNLYFVPETHIPVAPVVDALVAQFDCKEGK